MDISTVVYILSVTTATVLVIVLSFFYFYLQPNENKTQVQDPLLKKKKQPKQKNELETDHEEKKKKKKGNVEGAIVLKAHTDDVLGLDVSEDSSYLCSCSTDRTIRVWYLDQLETEQQHKGLRVNLEFDHGTCVKWVLPKKGKNKGGEVLPYLILTSLSESKEIVVLELSKHHKDNNAKTHREILRFKTKHPNTITSLSVSHSNVFRSTTTTTPSAVSPPLLATTSLQDTEVKIWDLWNKSLLQVINTNQLQNNMVSLSHEGRFLSVASRMSDIRIWEVMRKKDGGFDSIKKVMDLNGHSGCVYSVKFNSKSTRVYSCSKDMTWKLWNIDVRYHINESTSCLVSSPTVSGNPPESHLAISLDGQLVARSSLDGASVKIQIFSLLKESSAKLVETYTVPNEGRGDNCSLEWGHTGNYLFCSFFSKNIIAFPTSHLIQKSKK